MAAAPPDNPEDWTHEEWIAWLNASDADAGGAEPAQSVGPEAQPEPPKRLGATMLAGALKGLHDALYGPKDDEVVIVAPSREPDDDPDMTVHLDPEDPKQSWARLRRRRPTLVTRAPDRYR